MENDEEKMECSGIWRIRERLLSEMENLVKMKSRSGAMVWKMAKEMKEKVSHVCSQINRSVE